MGKIGRKVKKEKCKFSLRLLRLLLNTTGVFSKDQNNYIKVIWPIVLIIVFVITTLAQIFSYRLIHKNDPREIAETSLYVMHALYYNFTTFIINYKSAHIIQMGKIIKQHFQISSFSKGLFQTGTGKGKTLHSEEYVRKRVYRYGSIFCIAYITMLFGPFLSFVLKGKKYLIVSSCYPWDTDPTLNFLLTYLFQLISILILSLPVFANLFFIVYFICEIKRQVHNLSIMLKTINNYFHQTNSKIKDINHSYRNNATTITRWRFLFIKTKNWENQEEQIYFGDYNRYGDFVHPLYETNERYMAEIAQHHISIIRFARNFTKVYNYVFGSNLICSMVDITLIAYVILTGESTIRIVKHVPTLINYLIYLTLYCYLGQTMIDANSNIRKSLYEIQWDQHSIKTRKYLLIMMKACENPVTIKIGTHCVASANLYGIVLRSCYSYLNVLLMITDSS